MNSKLTGKANAALVIILGLLIAGLAARNGGVALLALPLVGYLAAGLVHAPGGVDLRADRETEGRRGEAGQPVAMRVSVENRGRAIPRLTIRDESPEGTEAEEGCEGGPAALPAGSRLEFEYRLWAGRGRYDWRTVTAAAADPFGLFEQRLKLEAPGKVYLLPPQLTLKGLRIPVGQTRATAGPHLSRRAGIGTDFYGVREYAPGDSLRRIHWRMSARHPGEFFSKEFEREEMANVGVLVDARLITNIKRDGQELLDFSVQAASTIANSFLNAGDRVSLLILGKLVTRVFPGTGKRQLVAVQEALAGCRPGENVSFETLRSLPVKLFPSHSLLVVVSPLRKEDFTPLSALRAEGYQVLLVSPDPVAFAAGRHARESADSLSRQAAALERALLLWRLRQQGLRVVSWQVDQPFNQTLRSTLWNRR